ncbi:unnamed protein product [Lupinus luteus]|uniref:HAT C-terminal dimerisation domain-containing protein n=1 Tax=Lupinus luteus TaxID=3873 RepID=A0AAV1XF17_LUPLU
MDFLYQAFYKAREDMAKRFQRNKKKVEPYLNIIDSRWDSQFRKNLHAAGYWLSPACRFNFREVEKHNSTISGLLDVIERYSYGDNDLNTKLTSKMKIFKNFELDFGRQVTIRERNTVRLDQWWESYGCGAPNLQQLAIRILSQTCSASGCERNWSVFEHIHSKKRNRLEHQKLNDLVYVRYNLHLQQRNRRRHQSFDPINFKIVDDHCNWVMEESPPFLTIQEVDALRNDLANMTIEPISDDIGQLNLDDDDDSDAQDITMTNTNQNESNTIEVSNLFDEEGVSDLEATLTPWT